MIRSLLLLVLIFSLGCSSSTPNINPPVAIKGQVNMTSGPLKNGALKLVPSEGRTELVIVKDGKFESTAMVGKYVVIFDKEGYPGKPPVAAKYTDATTSDITVEIPPTGISDLVVNFR